MRQLRSAPKVPGHGRIFVAGEKEAESEKLVRERGVPVNSALQKDLKFMQAELGLTRPQLPF